LTLKVSVKKRLRDFNLDVSLEAGDREILALMGENGCGKTTVLNVVAGLTVPDEGQVSIDGKSLFNGCTGVDIPPEKRNIGYLFQNYSLFPNMSVYDNVAFGLRMRSCPREELDGRVKRLLEGVDMWQLRSEKASRLSGGQKQRVALSRALAIEPSAFLLDEPLSALDAEARMAMRRDLKQLILNADVPTIIVTHSAREAMEMADRVYVMEKGRILVAGTPESVLRKGTSRFVDAILNAE